jgi:hypothetical protein
MRWPGGEHPRRRHAQHSTPGALHLGASGRRWPVGPGPWAWQRVAGGGRPLGRPERERRPAAPLPLSSFLSERGGPGQRAFAQPPPPRLGRGASRRDAMAASAGVRCERWQRAATWLGVSSPPLSIFVPPIPNFHRRASRPHPHLDSATARLSGGRGRGWPQQSALVEDSLHACCKVGGVDGRACQGKEVCGECAWSCVCLVGEQHFANQRAAAAQKKKIESHAGRRRPPARLCPRPARADSSSDHCA